MATIKVLANLETAMTLNLRAMSGGMSLTISGLSSTSERRRAPMFSCLLTNSEISLSSFKAPILIKAGTSLLLPSFCKERAFSNCWRVILPAAISISPNSTDIVTSLYSCNKSSNLLSADWV